LNRRTSLKIISSAGLLIATGSTYHWLSKPRDYSKFAIDLTVERIDKLKLEAVETTGTWDVARTFNHLAQSIEFSMQGFPQMKSPLFQKTAGQLAFSVFQARGKMTHDLAETIPGELVDNATVSIVGARNRLLSALNEFESFDGELKPHFAYGSLDKDRYAAAHVMHVNNHLEEFRVS